MLNYLLYYLLLLPLSYFPLNILYGISNIIFLVFYHLIGYRRKVVMSNIKRSFPDKTDKEHRAIEKEFYRHFADLMVESVKTFSMSEAECRKRMIITNPELPDSFAKRGLNIVAAGGHNSNWEMYAVAAPLQMKHMMRAFYTPMTNKFFDKVFKKSRSRFGLKMVPTYAKDEFTENVNAPTAFVYGIDQCPKRRQSPYWTTFLNQETGVQFGAEKFARDHKTPVLFGNIRKIKRGYYEVDYKLVCENPDDLPTGGIMEKCTRMLEEAIYEQPAYWLWSHKRWKYRKEEYANAS